MTQNICPDLEFQNFLREGRFMIQRCRSSGRHFFYPRVAEPGTGATDIEWIEAAGRGTVYSLTVVRPKPPASPYNVALIDLLEGPRMMSRVESADPASVQIGTPVKVRIVREDDFSYVVFDPEQS